MSMPNRRPENCAVCHVQVEPGQGFAMRDDAAGRWLVKCRPCSGVVADAKPVVAVAFDGTARTHATLTPRGYLGDALFARYKAACSGARYDGSRKCQVAPLGALGKVVSALHDAGFVVDIPHDVGAAVEAAAAAIRDALKAADARADVVDAALGARGMSLYGFQRDAVAWLVSRAAAGKGALLADDMGLGKTVQTFLALPAGAPVLVICPAVAKGVWRREAARWRPDMRVVVLDGLGSFRWPSAGEMVVVNYDVLPETEAQITMMRAAYDMRRLAFLATVRLVTIAPSALTCDDGDVATCSSPAGPPCGPLHTVPTLDGGTACDDDAATCSARVVGPCLHILTPPTFPSPAPPAPPGVVLVADEAHVISHRRAERTQCVEALADAVRAAGGSVTLLTATPLLNRAVELWTLLQVADLGREAFGSFETFAWMMGGRRGSFGWKWDTVRDPAGVVERLRRVSLRRTKADVLADLPPVRSESVDVDLDAAARLAVDKAVEGVDVAAAIEAARKGDPTAFRQMAKARAALATAKIPAAVELAEECEEAGAPVLVFSAHVAPTKVLGRREGWATITGATSAEERTAIEDRFQRGELRGIAGTIDACGVAITLTRAERVVFLDREWVPALNDQARDRAHRIGLTHPVLVTYLVADHPLDRRIAEVLTEKSAVVAASVDASRRMVPAVTVDAAPDLAAIHAVAEAEQAKAREAAAVAEERAKNAPPAPVAPEGASGSTGAATGPKRRRVPRRPARLTDAPDAVPVMPGADPGDTQKAWAAAALRTLAESDPDRAKERNGAGFSAGDCGAGHWLAYQVETGAGLTPQQWVEAIALCRRYHRQVGPCPVTGGASREEGDAAA